jgi:hypothetical protein
MGSSISKQPQTDTAFHSAAQLSAWTTAKRYHGYRISVPRIIETQAVADKPSDCGETQKLSALPIAIPADPMHTDLDTENSKTVS